MYDKTEITYIYILIDPIDNEVRYVGKTSNPKSRLSGHISECKRNSVQHHRARWIRSLLNINMRPIIKFIKVCPLREFVDFETKYIEEYKSDKLTNSDLTGQGNQKRIKEALDRQSQNSGRRVYQYDLNGEFIKEYRSTREAGKVLGIYHSHISRCCNGQYKHSSGFIFSYIKKNIKKIDHPNALKKSVIEIDSNGDIMCEWYSLMECSRDTGVDSGNISRVCNGKLKSIKGRIFRFKLK